MRRRSRFPIVLACALVCVSCSAGHGRRLRTSAPAHIETWAYVDSCHGVGPAQTSLVRRWVTYAETKCATDGGLAPADCHAGAVSYCTSMSYLDTNLDWSRAGLGMAVPSCTHAKRVRSACANEEWFVHRPGGDDRSQRLTWTSSILGRAYLLNGADPALDRFVVAYAHRTLAAFDGLMVDDVGASTKEQFYGDANPTYTESRELPTSAAVLQSHVSLAEDLAKSFLQVDNGLVVNPSDPPAFTLLNRPAAVAGLVSESYPEDSSTNALASWYSTGLDDMAYLEHTPALARNFLVLLGYNATGSLFARRVQEATVMLGFEPAKIVDWANLDEDQPGLAVWPEEGLYPTEPLQTMQEPVGPHCMNGLGGPCAHGHADLQVATGANVHEQARGAGVYRREYGQCFLDGAPIGGCAAIMNDTDRPVTISGSWLSQHYRHEMTMVGGELQSGGRLDVRGAPFTPGATTIAADDAALLSQ